jgi:hypothetical protein
LPGAWVSGLALACVLAVGATSAVDILIVLFEHADCGSPSAGPLVALSSQSVTDTSQLRR